MGIETYMVLFKQLTGIISPGLYPRASSALFMGSWPLNAAAKDENNATRGSHDGDFRCDIMAIMIEEAQGIAKRICSWCCA